MCIQIPLRHKCDTTVLMGAGDSLAFRSMHKFVSVVALAGAAPSYGSYLN